jgi:hypothetical protein
VLRSDTPTRDSFESQCGWRTCRDLDHHPDNQSHDAYARLTTAIEAHLAGQPTPSLLGGP